VPPNSRRLFLVHHLALFLKNFTHWHQALKLHQFHF